MAMTGQEFSRCAYPGCENELRPGEAAAEPGYCGLPDPVTGEPHTALTAFRRRQVLAGQGGGMAGPEDVDRPGFAFWRRAGTQRRQRAEAEAKEARLAALQADAQLAEALAAKAAADQEAVGAREAAQARAAEAERAAQQRMAATESRARDAGQEADRAREAAQAARAELDRARQAADQQVAQARQDAARDQAELRAGLEAQIAALEEARAGLQARAEQAEAELQRARTGPGKAAGPAAPGQPAGGTRRRRRPPGS